MKVDKVHELDELALLLAIYKAHKRLEIRPGLNDHHQANMQLCALMPHYKRSVLAIMLGDMFDNVYVFDFSSVGWIIKKTMGYKF